MKSQVKWSKRGSIHSYLPTLMIDFMINIEVISTVTDRIQREFSFTTRWHRVVVSKLTQKELWKEEYIVSTFKNRIHYSLEDFECTSNCPDDCTDSMARYRIYEGSGLTGPSRRLLSSSDISKLMCRVPLPTKRLSYSTNPRKYARTGWIWDGL